MSYEKLNSERVNYLVWRYLQEAGFGQSAARLQRDWGIQDPEKLPFASNIGPHGLVRLLQNGLHHLGLKASLSTGDKEHTPFFGPETAVKAAPSDEAPSATKPQAPSQRREGDFLTNGSNADGSALQASTAPKRSRRSNGAVNGRAKSGESMGIDDSGECYIFPRVSYLKTVYIANARTVPTSTNENEMEIDGQESAADRPVADSRASINAAADAPPGPAAGAAASGELNYSDTNGVQDRDQEQQLIPTTLTNGVSVGVQSEKGQPADLGPETAVLKNLLGKTLTQVSWNPQHPTLLAAGGRALCQIWSTQSAASSGALRSAGQATQPPPLLLLPPPPPPENSAQATAQPQATPETHPTSHTSLTIPPDDTTDLEIDPGSSVTALAWDPTGDSIAYSTFPDDTTDLKRSTTAICSNEGAFGDQLPSGFEPVVSLAWSPNGRYLAALSGKTVTMYDKERGMVLPPYEMKHDLLDVSWLPDDNFAMCGMSILATSGIFEDKIIEPHIYTQPELRRDWSQIRFDSYTSTLAVASEDSGHIALIEASNEFHAARAHETTLTDLAYRPMAGSDAISSSSARMLATSSYDGTIKLWNARAGLEHIHTFHLGAAALALCFTPDGRHVVGASESKMLFWSAQENGMPKAVWNSEHVGHSINGTHTNGTNGTNGLGNGDVNMEDEDEENPTLTWDSNGHKLAFACKDKVAIINYYQ